MNAAENKSPAVLSTRSYWWLWVFNALLVSTGILFFLATRYGTPEFFTIALGMAMLPFIPILVLIGGGGSSVFAVSKVVIEKRRLKMSTALAVLLAPGIVITLLFVLLGLSASDKHRLSYICAGHAPAAANEIAVTGYSAFLREEWLATFRTDENNFHAFATAAQLVPADGFEFEKTLEHSALKSTRVGKTVPPLAALPCLKRVFKDKEEHERGTVFAVFDAANSRAIVFRGYHD